MQPESNKFSGAVVRLLKSTGGPYAALVVLLLLCCLSNEHFRNVQNLINITRQVSYSGIIALGMTFVIAAGGIDLAVGSLFALAGVVSLFAMNAAGGPESVQLVAGLAAALGVGVIGGALNGVLVGAARVQPCSWGLPLMRSTFIALSSF